MRMAAHIYLFFFLEQAREYLPFAPCAHLFGPYAVYRSLLWLVWVWFGAQHASNSFSIFSRLYHVRRD